MRIFFWMCKPCPYTGDNFSAQLKFWVDLNVPRRTTTLFADLSEDTDVTASALDLFELKKEFSLRLPLAAHALQMLGEEWNTPKYFYPPALSARLGRGSYCQWLITARPPPVQPTTSRTVVAILSPPYPPCDRVVQHACQDRWERFRR